MGIFIIYSELVNKNEGCVYVEINNATTTTLQINDYIELAVNIIFKLQHLLSKILCVAL